MSEDAEDGDTLESYIDQTSAATVNKLLREALERRFDDLIEFEDASRPETVPWYIREKIDN